MIKKRLLDVSDTLPANGIIHALSLADTGNDIPFLHPTDTDVLNSLDYDYYFNHSGGKQVSPYIERLLESLQKDVIDSTVLPILAKSILARNSDEWKKLSEAYAKTVVAGSGRTETKTKSGTDTTEHTGTDTDTRTPTLTTTTSRDKDKNVDEKKYNHNGFNSSTSSPVDDTKETHAEETVVDEQGSDETTHEKNTTDTITYDTTETLDVTPSAQELNESLRYQIDLWSNTDLLVTVYNGIDKIMTSPVYL